MHISKIREINFQSHSDSTLELSEGMNVLFGESDHGKSSLIRGMRLAIENRPNGEKYRRHDTEETSVLIEKSNGFWAKRIRSDKDNCYQISTHKDPLQALRMDVPEDVLNGLNLCEDNIQSQDDVWFLINLSAGQISKKLNKVAGLELTDKVLKQVNSDIKSNKSEQTRLTKDIKDAQEEISDLEWAEKADAFLSKLEKLESSISADTLKLQAIEGILSQLESLRKKKDSFISEECITELNKLISFNEVLSEKENKYEKIMSISCNILSQKESLTKIVLIDVSELENMSISLESDQRQYDDIQSTLNDLKIQKNKLIEVSAVLERTEEKYKAELKRLGKCPTCGSKT
jgi:exonuclease SbcC